MNRSELGDESLSSVSGGTFREFVGLRQKIEQYCAQLAAKVSAYPEDKMHVSQIHQNLQSAMTNEPQCMYFLQQAGEAAKQLRDDKLRAEVLTRLDEWCDVIYQ